MRPTKFTPIRLALLATTSIVSAISCSSVWAAEYTVNTPTVVANGGAGNVVDGDDHLTVTADGSITTPSDKAIKVTGDNNVVTNAGSLSSDFSGTGVVDLFHVSESQFTNTGTITGTDNLMSGIKVQQAIMGGGNNLITNAGIINMQEGNSVGINISQWSDTGVRQTVVNSGTINMLHVDAIAGVEGRNFTFSNSGTINMAGDLFSGGVGISAGANSIIDNSGMISTSGGGAEGIRFGSTVGPVSSLHNTGTISTIGNNASAVFSFTGNMLDNAGTITTTGNNSYGIHSRKNGIITNSGSIDTSGNTAFGVNMNLAGNSLTNSGNITTSGKHAYGVNLLSDNTLTNSGNIVTTGLSAYGVFADYSQTVNSGSILTSGANAVGFYLNNGSGDLANPSLVNTGIVHTTGIDAIGIFGDTDSAIAHSGYLVSEQSESFEFANDTQLNLLAPAYIGGAMKLGSDAQVHVTTGRSHSNLWNFSDHGGGFTIDFTGPVPWAWDAATEEFASVDPTALSAAPDVLADQVGSLSGLVRLNRGNSNANNLVAADLAVVQYQALVETPAAPPPPKPVAQNDGDWWLAGYGNFGQYSANGVFNDYFHLNGGIAAGADFVLDENWKLGGFVGYQASYLNVNSRWVTSQTIFGQGLVGGIYGTVRADNIFADFALFGGWSANSSDRFVNDNLAPLGVAHALADYNSFFLAPEVRVGLDIASDGDWTLTPSASARFSNQWIDGYTETGSNANASVGARVVQVFEGDIELAATRELDAGELTLRGGVDYRQALGAATADVVLLGQTLAEPLNTAGAFGAYVGLDFNYDLSDDLSLDLSAKGTYRASGYAVSGSVGISGLF